MRGLAPAFLLILFAGCAIAPTQPATQPMQTTQTPTAPTAATGPADVTLVTVDSPSPLVTVRMMVKAGSSSDPIGKEGLARVTAESLIQGGFGPDGAVVTKERLAEITQPWGEEAMPAVLHSADTTTIRFVVPRDVLDRYIATVLRPMLTAPRFDQSEIERIRTETAARISAARFEDLENLGLAAIDEYVNEGTRYQHQTWGTDQGLGAIGRDDVVAFFQSFYRPGNIILGVSSSNGAVTGAVADTVRAMNAAAPQALQAPQQAPATRFAGRHAVVIDVPNAPAAGVHIGFPFDLDRNDADFWALYVANTWFGTHRDSFGRLYQAIRQERGYNYGNYSYLEHWNGRTSNLFQVFNQPRRQQYFSIWLRPVAHEYAYPMMKAATWELQRMVDQGLSDAQVASAKNKAKVLYVNMGETIDRLLAARVDDAFYGASGGFLENYLANIDRVTTAEVNAALRKYLQTANLKYLVATDSQHAEALAAQIRAGAPAFGKSLQEYQLEQVKLADGKVVWQIPDEKVEMLRVDALWAHYPLNISTVRVVPVTSIFRTGQFIEESR
jgi:zinc protease